MTMRRMPVLAHSQALDPYPALTHSDYFTLRALPSNYFVSDSSPGSDASSNSLLISVVGRVNTAIGNVASYLEQSSELALVNSSGWGLARYLRTFGIRNAAHMVGNYALGATVLLDAIDPEKTKLATGRDAAAGFVGFFGGPPGAIGAGAYFTIDSFYPGGVENYGANYLSVCSESGC
jgi:hypothetical protein